MKRLLIGMGGLFVIATAAFSFFGITINLTPSLPLGFYQQTQPSSSSEGLIAEFCPSGVSAALSRRYRALGFACPDHGVPLLKPVAAVEGDTVSVTANGITVNGTLLANSKPLSRDTHSRTMSTWAATSYRVASHEVIVVSTYHPGSFDSRYLGPIATSSLRRFVKPLWVF
jgi:conjugative transfer signal peptidase TraF